MYKIEEETNREKELKKIERELSDIIRELAKKWFPNLEGFIEWCDKFKISCASSILLMSSHNEDQCLTKEDMRELSQNEHFSDARFFPEETGGWPWTEMVLSFDLTEDQMKEYLEYNSTSYISIMEDEGYGPML